MALQNGSIPVGATYAPTGGTARTLKFLDNSNGLNLLIDDGSTYALKRTIKVATTDAVANPAKPGGYGPRRVTQITYLPKLLADGSYFTNTVKKEYTLHPETSSADIAEYRSIDAAQTVDADFDDLYLKGSKA